MPRSALKVSYDNLVKTLIKNMAMPFGQFYDAISYYLLGYSISFKLLISTCYGNTVFPVYSRTKTLLPLASA